MGNVDSGLYDFLKENETGLYRSNEKYTKDKIIAIVHVYFSDLEDFIEIVGEYSFEEEGIEVTMFADRICVGLNDIIEANDQSLVDYKKCFDKDNWNNYEVQIMRDWN